MMDNFYEAEEFPDSEFEDLSQSQSLSESSGSEYQPDQDQESEQGSASLTMDSQPASVSGDDSDSPLDAPKVIVFMSSLLTLLSVCKEPGCGSCVDRENMKVVTKGAMVRVHMLCNNNHSTSWDSSPVIGSGRSSVAVINILIGSYCLLTGLHIKQVLDFFGHLRLHCFGSSFFYYLQEAVVEKAIWLTWLFSQKSEAEKVKTSQAEGIPIHCSGDGQFDSPGHTASFCTYTIQNLANNAVLALYVAHKHQVKSSAEMEPYSCKTLLLNLAHEHGVKMTSFTTDRSSSVKTVLSELHKDLPPGHPVIQHYYDIWHFIKSILKDLWKASKLKSCSELDKWIPSINNMLWFSFASSIGNLQMLREKLLSIADHICNIHNFPANTQYKDCRHGPLTGERSKAWLKKDSLEVKKIRSAILGIDNSRINELPHMLGFTHTGAIESWNALHNRYANKNYYYGHRSMLCRGALACIDNNSNLDRQQSLDMQGGLAFDLVSNRAGSKWFVRPRKEKKDDSWRDSITNLVLQSFELRKRPLVEIPVPGAEDMVRGKPEQKPDKSEAVAKHQTRMSYS